MASRISALESALRGRNYIAVAPRDLHNIIERMCYELRTTVGAYATTREKLYLFGIKHCRFGPAVVIRNGIGELHKYYHYGKVSRRGGHPAIVHRHKFQITYSWRVRGKPSRPCGLPTRVVWYGSFVEPLDTHSPHYVCAYWEGSRKARGIYPDMDREEITVGRVRRIYKITTGRLTDEYKSSYE